MENTMTQTTTNNNTDTAPTIEGAKSTTKQLNKENIMENKTITEAELVSDETNITNFDGDIQMETEETDTVVQTMTMPQRVRYSKSSNIWMQRISLPLEAEIKEIREARRCELVTEFNEKIASNIIDKHIISSKMELVVSDGTTKAIEVIITAGKTTKTQDIIEPNTGNDVAVIKHRYLFDATYSTPLRGKEVYTIVFTVPSIKYILSNSANHSWENISKIKVLEALNENIILSNLDEEDIKIVAASLIENSFIEPENMRETPRLIGEFTYYILKRREDTRDVKKVSTTEAEAKAFEIMKDYAFLNNQGKPQIINTTKLGLVASSESGLKALFKNQLIAGINPVDIWMHSPNRPLFVDTKFDPSCSTEDEAYNLFKGFAHPAQKLIDIAMFKNFVKDIICSGDDKMYNIVWSFLAQMLQDPTRKMGTALVLLSSKGTGKSTFVKVIGELLKGYFYQSADNKRLLGEFNNHLESTLLFYANELTFTDNKRVISKLKNVITEKNFTYEIKGGATYSADNFIRVIIDSNDDMAVVQTADERRFIYPVISEAMIANTDYFNDLHRLFEMEGFYESLMYELMNFPYAPWEEYLKTPPKNEVTEAQVLESFLSIDSWWLYCLEEAKLPEADYTVDDTGVLSISHDEMYQSFRKYTLRNGGKINGMDANSFKKDFKKHILKDLDLEMVHRPTINGERKRLYLYSKLSEQVEHFQTIKKINNIDYDDGEWLVVS